MSHRGKKLPGTRVLVTLLALVFALALPAQSLAQAGDPSVDPTASQYASPTNTAGGGEDSGSDEVTTLASNESAPVAVESSGSTLPFTGFDVGVLAIVALLLGGTGLALRRLSSVR